MTRLDIYNQVVAMSNVQQSTTSVNFAIQVALNRVHQWFDWEYYLGQYTVPTTAMYTTGTAQVTNGSTTVTGVGTTFTSLMVGRKFRHANENAFYVISAYVSATQLTLASPYQGATDSIGSSYTIYKDEYKLAPGVDKYKKSIQIQNGVSMQDVPISTFDSTYPTPQSYSDPNLTMMVGTKLDTYSIGTIAATIGTNIITGTGTSWTTVEGLGRMSDIVLGSGTTQYRYTVKSVDSDTQITVYETISVSMPTSSAYKIILNNLVVQYYNIPSNQQNIVYRAYRIPEILANDYDVPDMPHAWHWILVYGALSFVYMQKGDIQKAQEQCEVRFIDGLNMMKLKLGTFSNNMIFKRKSVDRTGRFTDGLEASNYDIRYSRP